MGPYLGFRCAPPEVTHSPAPSRPPVLPPGGFLTRRIDYFRALAPSLANTRKSETPHFQTHPCDARPQGRPKTRFSPPFGTFRGCFSIGNRPWMAISIPWKQKSMGCFGRNIPWIGWSAGRTPKNNAGRSVGVGVRFNALTYSAQPRAGSCARFGAAGEEGPQTWRVACRSQRRSASSSRRGPRASRTRSW